MEREQIYMRDKHGYRLPEFNDVYRKAKKKKRVTGLWIVFYSPITWYHHPGDHTGLPCHFSFNQPLITPKIHDVETS